MAYGTVVELQGTKVTDPQQIVECYAAGAFRYQIRKPGGLQPVMECTTTADCSRLVVRFGQRNTTIIIEPPKR